MLVFLLCGIFHLPYRILVNPQDATGFRETNQYIRALYQSQSLHSEVCNTAGVLQD